LAMMVLLVANIIMRAIWRAPILGAIELTGYLMAFVVFFAIAYSQVYRRHIRVEVLASRFSRRTLAVFDVISAILGIVLFIVIAWQSALYGLQLIGANLVGMALGMKEGYFYFVVAIDRKSVV
jgi:TRAP-type C4-dicarboxylate transport system permease small subunit